MNLYRLRGELDRARMRHAYAIRERSRFEEPWILTTTTPNGIGGN